MEKYGDNNGFVYQRSAEINNVLKPKKETLEEERLMLRRLTSKDPKIAEEARKEHEDKKRKSLFLPNEEAALKLAENTKPEIRRFYYSKGNLVASELLDDKLKMIESRGISFEDLQKNGKIDEFVTMPSGRTIKNWNFGDLLKEEKADEIIDAESEAVAIKTLQDADNDSESGEPIEIWRWSVNYLDPKDTEFKGRILNQN